MSATDKGFGLLRAIFSYEERLKGIDKEIALLAASVSQLARSHADLSDRVARMEGFLEGAAVASRGSKARLPRE